MSTPTNAPPDEKGEELSIEEIRTRYKDKWIAIIVTKRDKSLQPARGRVVAEEIDRYRLREHLGKYRDVCILYGGDSPFPLLL